jgi:hypothetical protein
MGYYHCDHSAWHLVAETRTSRTSYDVRVFVVEMSGCGIVMRDVVSSTRVVQRTNRTCWKANYFPTRSSVPSPLFFLFVLLRSGDNGGKLVSQGCVFHAQKFVWKTIRVAHVQNARNTLVILRFDEHEIV